MMYSRTTVVAVSVAALLACCAISEPGSEMRAETIVDLPGLPEGAQELVLVQVPAGTFQMGSPASEPGREENEGPAHKVRIAKGFLVGKYEVTQAQWLTVMEENPSTQKGDDLPVNRVSWDECQGFLQRLNALRGTTRFRLPTEAEWEYACRAGTTTTTYFGAGEASAQQLLAHAWFRNNAAGELHPVGQKHANPWGLHDMYGNVWEWCQDWYAPYSSFALTDPQGPKMGTERIFRGASLIGRPRYLRSADRGKVSPNAKRHTGGFRVVWGE